ncbi:MAG: hypothetical protein JWR64_1618, partial [Marmoricola sp.]|nr:hypothetical protein [Marmoricola sp.]
MVSSPRTSPAVRSGRRPADSGWVAGFLDAAVVAVWFAVSGLIGALVW